MHWYSNYGYLHAHSFRGTFMQRYAKRHPKHTKYARNAVQNILSMRRTPSKTLILNKQLKIL